jgi:hypothetical protein
LDTLPQFGDSTYWHLDDCLSSIQFLSSRFPMSLSQCSDLEHSRKECGKSLC